MKDKDFRKLKKNAKCLRHIVEAENNPIKFANLEGLDITSPYSARLDFIYDGHVYEANLTLMNAFREHEGEPFAYAYYKMDGEIMESHYHIRNILERMEDDIAAEEKRRAAAIARKRAQKQAEEEEDEEAKAEARKRAAASRRRSAALRLRELLSHGCDNPLDSLRTKYVAIRGGMLVEEGPEVYRWRYGAEGLADLRQDALELGVVL